MEVNKLFRKLLSLPVSLGRGIKSLFIKKSEEESEFHIKPQLNIKGIQLVFALGFVVFLICVLGSPDEPPAEFAEKIQSKEGPTPIPAPSKASKAQAATKLWGSPEMHSSPRAPSQSINYNTSMILGSSGSNAKTQLRPGVRISLRSLDKTVLSQDPVPIMAEVTRAAITESGLTLPSGTKLYGEASFEKGAKRAQIHFTQASLPDGQIRHLSAQAMSGEGQSGVAGRISSDAVKNTTGEMLTTFIASLASGSMETGLLGSSKGGVKNGLLSAVGHTAEGRAQNYGEKLKTEREWMEIPNGMEFEALLNDSLDLQNNPSGGEK